MPTSGPRFSHGRSPGRLPSTHAPPSASANPSYWAGHSYATPSQPATSTYQPSTVPTAPKSSPTSALLDVVSRLLVPDVSPTELAAAADRLGVKPLKLQDTVSAPQRSLDTFKPTGPTPRIRHQEVLDHAAFLKENGGVPAPVDRGAPKSKPAAGGDWKFSKADLHPNEKAVGEHEIDAPAPVWSKNQIKRFNVLEMLAGGAWKSGDMKTGDHLDAVAHRVADRARFAPQPGAGTFALLTPQQERQRQRTQRDPLGKKTVGYATIAELAQAQREGKLGINKRGKLTTPQVRQALAQLRAARQAVAKSRGGFGPTKDSGQLSPEEWAQLIVEEGRRLHAQLSPHDVAEGVGVVEAESGGNTDNTAQIADLGPARAHIGAWAEEESGFGTKAERLDPRKSTNLAIQRFLADGRSWDPAWVHWQSIQGENETGADRAPLYVQIARQALKGGKADPQAVARLEGAAAHAEALGIAVPAPGQKQGNFTLVHQTAKTALQWAEGALGVSTGSKREVHFAELVGGVTDPWCAVFVSTALKKVGIEPPANPSYSGAFMEDWKGGKVVGRSSSDFSKAQPGDLLIFDWGSGGETDHVAIYKGGNQMIGGNQGEGEVSLEEVPVGNIVGIVRPNYSGKKVPVSDEPVAGGALGEASTGGSGAVGTGGSTGAALASSRPASAAFGSAGAELGALLQPLALEPKVRGGAEEEPEEGTLAKLLRARRL